MWASEFLLNTEFAQLSELTASEEIQEATIFIFSDPHDLPLHTI